MSTNAKPQFVVRDAKTGQQVGKAYDTAQEAEDAKNQQQLQEATTSATPKPLEVKSLLKE